MECWFNDLQTRGKKMIVNLIVPKVTKDGFSFLGNDTGESKFLKRLKEFVLAPICKEWGGCSYHDAKGLWMDSEDIMIHDDVLVVRVGITKQFGSDEVRDFYVKGWFRKLANEIREKFSQDSVYFEILHGSTVVIVSADDTYDSSVKPKPDVKPISDITKGITR